ncbi:DUF6701 domain-containing protein [Undibacterium fentianense]|uniref:DUF6701 domain-containing protein n=1 Tax=Undibacterium fentianense TaxID=2828728 RepID=A0A941E7E2_9BURK|nr:DUF6701 domain-containing protein [Undibacterium fentianense]MBR7800063.1 hypothetical protein [Undibacterium fentianense]
MRLTKAICLQRCVALPFSLLFCVAALFGSHTAWAQTIEFNSTGGTTTTNGLHFYIDRSSKMQVRRANNTGQVYNPNSTPTSSLTSLDNGVFIRANNLLYGPTHTVTTFNPTGGMYSSYSITAASPANPSTPGVQQTATNSLGITNGPQVSIIWKYTTPLDFLTAEVTLTIPAGFAVSASNPVRYYHVFDTYLGGSDSGCGVNVAGSKRIVGTYSSLGNPTPCPVSTSLPTAGTIVESFRERTPPSAGPGVIAVNSFSSYCAAGWSTFFVNGSPYCSMLQLTTPTSSTGAMSQTITTTLQDTGIGIAYDFTAPGTYVFSYDFVIGSTAVPPYDHLEIRHDGSINLCPENLQVLACLSSTVPCPAGSELNSGTLTGAIALSPAASGVTFTPSTFSIGGSSSTSGSTANIILQATAASAGTYNLIPTGLSDTPLNGTRCVVNGVAQSNCQLTITNTPCVSNFECMETGASYNNPVTATNRNPLYTKLANRGFRFDVVALQTGGAIANTYAGNVVVELFDSNAAPSCSAATAITSQNLSFVAADNGRKTLGSDLLLADAYKKLGCRVRTTSGPAVTACSSDQFTVRPQSFSTISSNANADSIGASVSATPIVLAGNDFSLFADTGVKGYDGLPKLAPNLIDWPNVPSVTNGGRAAPGVGSLTGNFSVAANPTTGNGASGASFKYDETGYFRLLAQAVYDDTFVANSGSADSTNNDCTNDSSNTLVGGKYGCKFANISSSNHFGRFIPHHFKITTSASTLTEACPSATGFTYFGQDGFSTNFSITAENSSGNKTQNYTSTFAKLNTTVYSNYQFTIVGAPAGASLTAGTPAPSGSWLAGMVNVTAKHQISRPSAISNETLIALMAAPTDGEVPAASATSIASTRQRYGRLKLQSAYGSEMLDLPVPFIAEYRNSNIWLKNVDDNCTPVVAPVDGLGAIFYSPETATNHLSAGETNASVSATGKFLNGDGKLKFSKPGSGNSGYLDLDINVPDWLKFPWRGGVTPINPTAKVQFGTYKKSNQIIYTREIH